jgi:hypothetical protein
LSLFIGILYGGGGPSSVPAGRPGTTSPPLPSTVDDHGDPIIVCTWLTAIGRTSIEMEHSVTQAGRLLGVARGVCVFLQPDMKHKYDFTQEEVKRMTSIVCTSRLKASSGTVSGSNSCSDLHDHNDEYHCIATSPLTRLLLSSRTAWYTKPKGDGSDGMGAIMAYKFVTRYSDIDALGHVNNVIHMHSPCWRTSRCVALHRVMY